jgi:hypothetical protein
MRIADVEAAAIRRVTTEVAGEAAMVTLFESRTDAAHKGGDIDIWIDLPVLTADKLPVALRASARLQSLIVERKIDVLVTDPQSEEKPLIRAARHASIPLRRPPARCASRPATNWGFWLTPVLCWPKLPC